MNENKISVIQYIENEDLLEISYTPYSVKKEIVNTIVSQVTNKGDMRTIDTALLNRVSCEIFIEAITNIDMSIEDENKLSGYDLLCMNNKLDDLLFEVSDEYGRFVEILECVVSDFIRNNNSTSATLLFIVKKLTSFGNEKLKEILEYIEDIDVKNVGDTIKKLIAENLDKYKGK